MQNPQQNTSKQIQQHIKQTVHRDQGGFIPGMEEWFNITKSNNVLNHINRTNGQNHIIVSIHGEKSSDKILYLFMI